MVTTCARLTECRINGDKVDYIANSCDGNIKFIYHASLGTVESDLPCKLNHIVKVDHDPIHRDHNCIMECTKEYSVKCIPLNKECFEDSVQQCTKWCARGASEWSRGETYSIASRMEFATDSQCPEYLDCL